ncbi:DASH complex subunit Ask1-domain-containing protein [Cantharellus anzutake]|uniref:DASH complex subunit Ask1-domain-containing protein n=1 Tax=Cantharellus anzutake TaxID=1750568 RepID=UPI001907C2B1|nr:DASH complex subunit Ask1-domain-containing protein [Cantharellus anzutake]KAF8336846.1 DASH complex subunit Ask1-domain-containing protein [Cantharellus anzutake]
MQFYYFSEGRAIRDIFLMSSIRVPNPDPGSIVVPGLDTSAPAGDQIEYMDQLITQKLQNIDEIFADIHNIIISQLLPTIREYSKATQPTREAARFWKNFFEMAANVKIGDPEGEKLGEDVEGSEGEHGDDTINASVNPPKVNEGGGELSLEQDGTPRFEHSFASDRTPDNVSFAPPVASTPASGLHREVEYSSSTIGSTGDISTDISLPHITTVHTLGTSAQLSGVNKEDVPTTSQSAGLSSNVFSSTPSPGKKQRRRDSELRQTVLRQNLKNAATPRRPLIKGVNPFQPSTSKKKWNGIVDLQHYTPSTTEESTIDFGFTPAEKLKFLATPRYKLMRNTAEEAVAIRMAEVRARLPPSDTSQSNHSTSTSISELVIPPTPLSAAKRKQQLRQSLLPRRSLGIKRSNLLRDDDDLVGWDDGDTDFDDSPDISRKTPSQPQSIQDDSDSDSDFGYNGNDESPIARPQIYNSNSDTDSNASSDSRAPPPPIVPFNAEDDDFDDDDDSLPT